ncbi:MAG: tyrosine--tRNA ligase [Candidatus Diapherotrites archaeon]
MDVEERINLVKQVGEEIITEEELRQLFETKQEPIVYDGFEPSGKIHIAQGLLRAININKMIKAKTKFKLLIADWHAWANNKFSGNMEKISLAGNYMVEVWKACDLDFDKVEIVYASSLVEKKPYWEKVMKIATTNTLNRIIRCSQIMGRTESETLYASQILYPCMQAADIFELNVDIAQLGMDQRKVNMLAREVGEKLGYWKPIAVHHHMLLGLIPINTSAEGIERAIQLKMSKSKPDSAIFMTDTKEEVDRKINKAYCPEKIVKDNPILEYCKYIIFEKFREVKIERPQKFGGNIFYFSYNDLEKDFVNGNLHPLDLKKAVAWHVNELLEPIRKHFEKNQKAKKLLEKISYLDREKQV